MTEAFTPEEIAAWRDEYPEQFAECAAENAEEYETWLKANPEYAKNHKCKKSGRHKLAVCF